MRGREVVVTRYWCEVAVVGGVARESVAVDVIDGRFAAIVVGVAAPDGAVRLRGITVPGLANTHSHVFHRALRSRTQADRGSFWTWRDLMYRAAGRLDPNSYRRLATATFAEMAGAGITAVGEFHYVHHQPDGTPYDDANAMGQALLDAAVAAGIRITLLDALYLHGGLDADGYRSVSSEQRRFGDESAGAWAARVSDLRPGAEQRIGAAIHSVRAVDPAAMTEVAAWSTDHDAPLHVHASEQVAENDACLAHHGRTPVGVLYDAGVLGRRCSAVHATHLTDDDVALLAASGSTVSMCPTTERDLGDGIARTDRFAETGIAMTLGSDSHAVIDLFEEARALELHERLRSQRRGIHGATELLAMATAEGHRSLGWDDAGDIAVGQRADLVAVTTGSVRTAGAGVSSAVEAVVFAATAGDVTDVVIDGRPVVTGGRHVSVDVPRELDAAITDVMES
ncbi:formimidoylglutamate deiminase [soil metagenome]